MVALLVAERDSLRRYVTGLMTHDPHGVEDVVQETLLRAWQLASYLQWHDRPIRMWLFRVARNLVADRFRRNPRPDALTSAGMPRGRHPVVQGASPYPYGCPGSLSWCCRVTLGVTPRGLVSPQIRREISGAGL